MKRIFKDIIVQILEWEAKACLKKRQPKVVSITGSVGKTSTKDAVAQVLESEYSVWKSSKSYNSEIGVPLSILGLKNAWSNPFAWSVNIVKGLFRAFGFGFYPEWVVLEIGADTPGDIKNISKWLESDAVIITRLPDIPVHVEFFETPAKLIEEKLHLLKTLKREGALVINYDDKEVLKTKSMVDNMVYTYGFDPGANIWASNYDISYEDGKPIGIQFRIDSVGNSMPANIYGSLGKHQGYAALAGIALGQSQGINFINSIEALRSYQNPKGRMRLIDGIKDTIIIDDSYNSSPSACEAALETLEVMRSPGRKIVVLGDMAELGTYSEDAHKKIGKQSASIAEMIYTVGKEARMIAEGALNEGFNESKIFQFEDSRKAGKHLELELRNSDVILVKGSQSMRCEKVVEEIMAEPERKDELLVRQEREWQKRSRK